MGRVGRSFAAADDLARDVLLAVLAALPRGGDSGRPVLAFVYAITSSRVDQATGGETGAGGPELRRLLATLPETQREVVLLRMILGLSADETAEAAGMSSSAVRLAQHRALQRLRGSFGVE
ncbi:MAG: sigma factor-like helix-turn-helix DNA-binding protein [Actinophytocola sp.]|uniref:sigma factor-like helix-turn-helix DNA-binding protein n=1 Tax=Actinophytocola sp. TaxID=1872138 RepID=UPI003D6C3F41